MVLRAGYLQIALKMQEAADSGDSLSANDIRTRLSDAINDQFRGTGQWAYYIDHFGDAESGDVIYSCGGDTRKASYSMTETSGASKCVIDFQSSVDVVPRTIYEEEAEEDDHYAAMEESLKSEKLYSGLPLYERFITKAERDKATADDFAGKGRSFPILKPEDVTAAARSIGRAGSGNLGPSGLKSRIIAIAKRKGWEKYLPKAWQDSSSQESRVSRGTKPGQIVLTESASCLETIVLKEAKADYEIKLIAPGKGSSAFYPREVLQRDGPKVFKAGTHVYLNHPTAAEEAARPEGDVKNLAGVLTTDAVYRESHPKGEGLYGRMKVFADHAQMVEEKASHVGMSIRANGVAESDKHREGLPVLKQLTSAESVDVVTRAGAGGMILTEAARPQSQEVSMDAAELQKMQESQRAIEAQSKKLLERAVRGDARELASQVLRTITLDEAAKDRIVTDLMERELPLKDGELDRDKFREAVNTAAKREGEYLARVAGSGRVFGMGTAPIQESDPAKIQAREAEQKRLIEADVRAYMDLGLDEKAAKLAAGKVA